MRRAVALALLATVLAAGDATPAPALPASVEPPSPINAPLDRAGQFAAAVALYDTVQRLPTAPPLSGDGAWLAGGELHALYLAPLLDAILDLELALAGPGDLARLTPVQQRKAHALRSAYLSVETRRGTRFPAGSDPMAGLCAFYTEAIERRASVLMGADVRARRPALAILQSCHAIRGGSPETMPRLVEDQKDGAR